MSHFKFSRALLLLFVLSSPSYSAIPATLSISEIQGTSIARDVFPLTLKLSQGNVYLTEPKLIFMTNSRVGVQVRLQAYDHRPVDGIAISEVGNALFSGILGFDPVTREVLVYQARIDELKFDRSNEFTRRFSGEIDDSWREQIKDPIRTAIPANAYTLPIKDNIQSLSYTGRAIEILVVY